MEQNKREYTPMAGGPPPTLEDARGNVGILGMMHMHWRSLNELVWPARATPPAPAATGEAGERERRLLDTVRLALEHDAPHVRLGTFNWPVYMRELLQLFEATRAQLQQATAAAEGAGWVPSAFKPSAQPDGSEVSAPVLVYAPNLPTPTKITKAMYCHDTGIWEHCLSPMALNVTHWRPLLAPPTTPAAAEPGEGRGS